MDKNQIISLWLIIASLAILLFFSPWKFVYNGTGDHDMDFAGPYQLLFTPPSPPSSKELIFDDGSPFGWKEWEERHEPVSDDTITVFYTDPNEQRYFHDFDKNHWGSEVDFGRLILPVAMVIFIALVTYKARPAQKEDS